MSKQSLMTTQEKEAYRIGYERGRQEGLAKASLLIQLVWIICNEIISILENIKDIGAPVPPFLLPLLKNLKSQVEEVAKTEEKEEE